ncbi:conserved virulence factor C family protein [Peribacillus alkalitolerans]|uniref:conserved virulence factor C family protein n=1 Tax=Peribacillus alkalitolerans TaxID=1550385 RepID=UPI0013D0704B|nr:conserved virulence factor C family protein [Peribacillus alkalitolerans]
MKIVSIEPTPSPNTMKITLDEELAAGKSNNYKVANKDQAPSNIRSLLEIEGVKGVYHVADFLAIERNPKFDWKQILASVRQVFGEGDSDMDQAAGGPMSHYGEISVHIQMFKGIPMQIKLNDGEQEARVGLPEYFITAVSGARLPEDNVVILRQWKDYGVRYGNLDEVGNTVVEEISAAYPTERLQELVKVALDSDQKQQTIKKREKIKLSSEILNNEDWKIRYQALEQMDDPELEDLPLLEKALDDEKASIRRLATVYLGMIKDPSVLQALYKALKDSSVSVRRTAGDCLSDLGFKEAMNEMSLALKDSSKLVRWRAAMFLYEEGDESVLSALKEAENDPEFEVAMQVKMAIERIQTGEEAKGSIWKQMTELRENQ